MKNLIVILALFIGSFANGLASDPVVGSKTLISTSAVELSLEDVSQYKYFRNVGFNIDDNTIDIKTMDDIKYIQIFTSAGELQFQLPVMSDKVRISKNLFKQGTYRIGFILENMKQIQFTNLQVNE